MTSVPDENAPVVRLKNVSLVFGKTRALDDITLDIPTGRMVGLIGPDGVGKSSMLSLVTGARMVQKGDVIVMGGDMRDKAHRLKTCPKIAYMPQGLGKNLYPTLSVEENADFFGRLFGLDEKERAARIAGLLKSTGLDGFEDRPAGKLSGGMKQKLGLICSLIHDPELLVLDEPTTGVDPLARRQFWDLIDNIRKNHPSMSVIVATAYMEEAERFDWLIAMDDGKIMDTGTPKELMKKTGTTNLDSAFIELMPQEKRAGHTAVVIPPRQVTDNDKIAIEAEGLTMRFGDFTAVDHVSFKIGKGEIFGFLGSNGCGKSTTMKMLTGLLQPTEGTAKLFGKQVEAGDIETRRHVGYMSQAFSLYSELTVHENLALHTKLYRMDEATATRRIAEMTKRFDLGAVADTMPDTLPLGIRQRLSLAVALIHDPQILILDEPTSGVDPIARDELWQTLGELSRKEGVTIFVSTHFMNEAERCDRISLMHAGRVLISDTPAAITKSKNAKTLEEAFIDYLQDAIDEKDAAKFGVTAKKGADEAAASAKVPARPDPLLVTTQTDNSHSPPFNVEGPGKVFSLRRMASYAHRETLELRRDPIRATLALLGSLILMLVIGYGVNMDVENLSFAVLDHDKTELSRDYISEIAGSRYFIAHKDVSDYNEIDERMRSGELSLVIEIPPRFAEDVGRGRQVSVGAWIDGAMPQRAETIRGYVQGMHAGWLKRKQREMYGKAALVGDYTLQIRYRYNPGVESLPAMVPAVIPLLLLMIPSMLAALSVVREKEMGSIINLYVTPTTRFEFLLGKQIPYVVLGVLNCVLLWLVSVFIFKVDFTGGLLTFMFAGFLYVAFATAFGLLISTFMSSQIAAIFGVSILTLLPASQFSGLIDPVSSLEGAGAFIGHIYPTTYFMTISRGTFSKGLDFADLAPTFLPLFITPIVLMILATLLLRKQAR